MGAHHAEEQLLRAGEGQNRREGSSWFLSVARLLFFLGVQVWRPGEAGVEVPRAIGISTVVSVVFF